MKYSYAFALAAAQLASAHTTFQSFIIDGKDQGHHFAVRTPSNGNNPILDVTDSAMTCNGGAATADSVEVASGSEITFQWHHNDPATENGDADEPIAASHKGPVMVYIAPAASEGKGDVWVKLYEEGLTNGKWAVETFIANKGQHSITLPNLAAGDYLIRPEIIALHEGNRQGGAQFYNGCGQIKVTGGSVELPAGVALPGAYSASDPGVLFDIYSGATSYTIPGPKVWDGAAGSGSGSTPSKTAAASSPAATSAAATSAAAPATSAAAPATSAAATSAAAEATPVESEAATSAAASAPAATSAAAPAPSQGSGSSTLPEEFTLPEFIAWLKATAGTSGASKVRRHARSFFG